MLAVAVAFLFGASCLDPTEITIEIETDLDCAEIVQTEVFTGAGGSPNAQTSACKPSATGGRIGSIVVVPSGASGPVDIRVLATLKGSMPADCARDPGSGCIDARRRLGFIPHAPLHLPLLLSGRCRNVVCDNPDTTCVAGKCLPKSIDPRACKTLKGCDESSFDAGPPCPGGIPNLSAVSTWHFDEGSGPTTTALGLGGTVPLALGVTFVQGPQCNSGLRLDANTPSPMPLVDGNAFKPSTALGVWVRFKTSNGAGLVPIASGPGFALFLNNGLSAVAIKTTMGTPVSASSVSPPVANNVWHSLALTWRSTTTKVDLSIDGVVSVALAGVVGTIEPYAGKVTVGSPALAGGAVDELYLYDTAP